MNIWFYPYTSPLILTDDLFQSYKGETGTSTAFQRQKAYLFAERKASEDLHTYLQETTVTGTYAYQSRIPLMHNFVQRITRVRFEDFEGGFYWTISGTDNVYASLWNQERGLLDMGWALGNCACSTPSRPYPYRVEVVYDTGLPSGTVYNSEIPLALTTYASIILNEIEGFGNESVGDVQVKEYKNQEYSEVRGGLIQTIYGGSAKANFAWKLLSGIRKRKYVGL